MSYFLPHLPTGWHVDQAILSEEDRVVIIRFGHDTDPTCIQMDETLYKISTAVQNFAVIYLVDITQVPDFNKMYELYDPCSTMFFYRNKHIMIDLGTGNNNKINWAITERQELIDIVEVVYRGANGLSEEECKTWYPIGAPLFPKDTNAKQYFDLSGVVHVDERRAAWLRFELNGSTDDNGKVTIYQAEFFGV